MEITCNYTAEMAAMRLTTDKNYSSLGDKAAQGIQTFLHIQTNTGSKNVGMSKASTQHNFENEAVCLKFARL